LSQKDFKFRKVWVLRECAIDPKKLKKGDVFRFEKATADDVHVDPSEYYICKARPKPTPPQGNMAIDMSILIHPKLGKTLNFRWIRGSKQ